MARKSKVTEKTNKASSKNAPTTVSFRGIGSYKTIKNNSSPKGLYWTLLGGGKVALLDTFSKSMNELFFDSYSDFVNYCKNNAISIAT